MTTMSLLGRVAVLALLACAFAAPAAASPGSITYIKDGDVWLSSPDGAAAYQLTAGGGWASPSQADDGTVVAQRGTMLVRLTRSGQTIGTPFDVVGGAAASSAPGFRINGPYDPKVSPDGKAIAYWFTAQDATATAPGGSATSSDYADYTTTTPSDHFAGGPLVSAYETQHPSWIGNERLLLTDIYAPSSSSVMTWVPGGGADHEQWWFGQREGIVEDAALSRDGARMAAAAATEGLTSAADKLWIWTLDGGPSSTGAPPYDNLAPGAEAARPPKPALRCQLRDQSTVVDPTWSPDGRELVYADDSGVRILGVPDDLGSCAGFVDRALMAGASDPDWGPAAVDMAQRPDLSAPAAVGAGTTAPVVAAPARPAASAAPALSRLRLQPATFRVVRHGHRRPGGSRLSWIQAAQRRVTLVVRRCRTGVKRCVTVAGRRSLIGVAGHNAVRFTGRFAGRGLAPGRYRLTLTAGKASRQTGFRVVR